MLCRLHSTAKQLSKIQNILWIFSRFHFILDSMDCANFFQSLFCLISDMFLILRAFMSLSSWLIFYGVFWPFMPYLLLVQIQLVEYHFISFRNSILRFITIFFTLAKQWSFGRLDSTIFPNFFVIFFDCPVLWFGRRCFQQIRWVKWCSLSKWMEYIFNRSTENITNNFDGYPTESSSSWVRKSYLFSSIF